MSKPLYLYHASSHCDLKIIEPRKNTAPEGFKKGPVVFATDSFPFVTQFLVPHDDSWANGGAFGSTYFFVISDGKRFKKVDKGGCVYLVLSDNFTNYNKREWFSRKSVKTAGKVHFSSGLDAMIITKVQVYFVKLQVYEEIQNSKDHGVSILNNLKSENEKRGLKVKKLEFFRGSKKLM